MNYVKLGNTGLDVSPICLGCMSFGSAEGWVHNDWALNEECLDWDECSAYNVFLNNNKVNFLYMFFFQNFFVMLLL